MEFARSEHPSPLPLESQCTNIERKLLDRQWLEREDVFDGGAPNGWASRSSMTIRLDVLHNIYEFQQSVRYWVRDVEVLSHNQSLNKVMQKTLDGYKQAWTQLLSAVPGPLKLSRVVRELIFVSTLRGDCSMDSSSSEIGFEGGLVDRVVLDGQRVDC